MAFNVIDLHCDSVFSIMAGKDLRKHVEGVHVDLPRLRKGRVALQVFAAYVPPETAGNEAFRYALERLDAIETFARSDDLLAQIETAAELREILKSERTGVMAAVENGLTIENSLENLEHLRRRKVRIMTLVHSQHLPWIASCSGTVCPDVEFDTEAGLSRFGERVVDAMNDLGIIPDVSHSSESAFWSVIKRSKKPIIASHSCAHSLCAAPRNLKDDQLKALKDSGGLVGVNFNACFLSEPYRLKFNEMIKKDPLLFEKMMMGKQVPPTQTGVSVPSTLIADHIDYMVRTAGEDCVALGSDFDGIPATPEGVTGSDFFPVLEEELISRGYSENRIEKIFSANFLRVLEAWG